MATRVPANGARRRTAIAATLALTALVSAPLLETTLAGQSAAAPAGAGEKIDYDAIYKIKDEAVNRSQVMETLSYLTDVRFQPDFGKCRSETFGSTPMPAHTLLIISQLAWPGMLVEVDVTAMVPLK